MKSRPGTRMHDVTTIRKPSATDADVVKIKTENIGGFGAIKIFVIAAIIGVQLALMIFLHVRFVFAFTWYMIAACVMSLLTCVYILSSNKNSLSKAVWIIFLLIGFSFAFIIYWLSDERIFFYRARKRYRKIYKNAERFVSDAEFKKTGNNAVDCDCRYLKASGNFTAYTDTSVKYFSSGATFFDDVLYRLEKAEKFVFMEFFILANGSLLNRFFDVLAKKVAVGVDVRIIYDDMGSNKTLTRKTVKQFKKAGVKLIPFNRLVPIFSVAMNYRDHRKMIIIDGETVYSGGCNLADEYVNEKRMHGYWKDNGIRLDGPAVDGFTLMFLRQWEFLRKRSEDYSEFLNLSKSEKNGSVVVPYADGLDFSVPVGKGVYENMIAAACEKIYVMTPYFIVDDTLAELLINKATSGADVRIILPEIPDKKIVYGVSRNNAEKLMDYGVKVYLMKKSFVHGKVVLTENSVVVGSINMDLRSFYQQFECAVYTNDETVMKEVCADFENTFKDSLIITEKNKARKNIIYRVVAGFLQVFAPFM